MHQLWRHLLALLAVSVTAGHPLSAPQAPTQVDPFGVPYAGRFGACDAEGVVPAFVDPCACFCLHWACVHTEWAALTLSVPDQACASEYIKSRLGRDEFGYLGAIDACIKANCTASAALATSTSCS